MILEGLSVGWLVGPWCKVGLAEVVRLHRFVVNVLLIRATDGFRRGRVWIEVVLVGARCRRCGFPSSLGRVLAAPGFVRVGGVFRTCGFSLGESENLTVVGWQLGRSCGFSRGDNKIWAENHQGNTRVLYLNHKKQFFGPAECAEPLEAQALSLSPCRT